jgi:hypothetical protein
MIGIRSKAFRPLRRRAGARLVPMPAEAGASPEALLPAA